MKISKYLKFLFVFSIFLISLICVPVLADEDTVANGSETKEEKEKKAQEEAKRKKQEKINSNCNRFLKDDAPLLGAAYGISIDYDMDSTHKFVIHMDKDTATSSKRNIFSKAKFVLDEIDIIELNSELKETSSRKFKTDDRDFSILFRINAKLNSFVYLNLHIYYFYYFNRKL